jgi:hypothetical protein
MASASRAWDTYVARTRDNICFGEPKEESNRSKLFTATPKKCKADKEEKVTKEYRLDISSFSTMYIAFWSTDSTSAPFPCELQQAPYNGVETSEVTTL